MSACRRRQAAWLGVLVLVASIANVALAAETKVLQVYFAEKEPDYLALQRELIVPAFEALYPGVKVEIQVGGWSAQDVLVRYVGGSPPDVIQTGSMIGGYVEMLLPLNRFVENWDGIDDIPPAVIESVSVDGNLYAIPFTMDTRTLTYRKDFFAEAGLDPEQPPRTWEELLNYGTRLVRYGADNRIVREGFHTSDHYIDFAPFLFQAGGNYMSDDLTRITFADEPGMKALRFVRSLFHEHNITDPTRQAGNFQNGGAAMEYLASGAIGNLSDPQYTGIANEDIGVGLPPADERQTQIIMPNSWAILNTTPYPEEAWAWIEFSTRIENILSVYRQTGLVPPRMSVVNYSPWGDDPRWSTIFQAMAMAMTTPIKSPYFDELRRNYVQPTLQRIFYQGEPETLWVEQQERAQAWLNENLGR